ncbi:MAG: SGNH/GDSL hydrolase family protein [Lentisphaeria bacterium]|nr:SGNH/GDSL hydrolase family protein [Lentisphaeria bacterium]
MLSEVKWHTVDAPFFRLTGFEFRQPGEPFRRFEEKVQLPPAVEQLALHTPGGQLAFMTDSPFIRIKFSPLAESHLAVNTRIGAAGFDLYAGKPGQKQYFCGVSRMKIGENEFDQCLVDGMHRGMWEYTLHFPLYSGVSHLSIGLAQDAVIAAPTPWKDDRPIVYYGTSIIHGGCANRPGMALTNILSRRLKRPVLNFGFSGSGKGEPEVFAQLARVRNAAMFVLDYGPNVTPEMMRDTLGPGIDILRCEHKAIPILVVGKLHYIAEYAATGSLTQRSAAAEEMTAFQKEEVRRRRRKGERHVYFIQGDWSVLPDWTEFTVDGVHPTDLGFYMFSRFMEKYLRKYL